MKKSIVIVTAFIFIIMACSKSNDSSSTITCSGTQSFTADVNPIIQSFCAIAGCHASGSTNGPGALTTYSQIFNNRSGIRSAVANGSMPQNSSLAASQKSAIICWIDSGATNN